MIGELIYICECCAQRVFRCQSCGRLLHNWEIPEEGRPQIICGVCLTKTRPVKFELVKVPRA